MPSTAKEKIILALDVPGRGEASRLLSLFRGRLEWVKIGLQLFVAEGPGVVREARGAGFRVFLDLKIHDIPNTARHAVRSAAASGAEMLTVHALGGPAMLEAAAEEGKNAGVAVLGVTYLTSMDSRQTAAVGLDADIAGGVLRLAALAKDCGLDGAVASPLELPLLRPQVGGDFTLVIPGIRPAGADAGDQKRTLDPRSALDAGASYLVIGRPITAAPDPVAALDAIAATL